MNRIANADNIAACSHKQSAFLLFSILRPNSRVRPETECKINGERLGVTWRRVVASVPQKVFEVQVSSNLYSAIGKLKKAHLYGNSQPFPVLIYVLDGAGGGSRTLTGLLSPADFLTVYGFRRPDAASYED